MDRRLARHHKRDSRIFRDDCIEVYLNPTHDHNTYKQFVVNTLNTQYDATGPFPASYRWNAKWRSAVMNYSDHYIVEIAIPFKEIGVPMPKPYEVWGGNVFRQVWVPGFEEWSGWSPTNKWFHEPGFFGHFIFSPEPIP